MPYNSHKIPEPDMPEKTLQHFLQNTLVLKPAQRLLVGFSGGLDSATLLHALDKVGPDLPLLAIHVHHGLSPNADYWAAQAQAFCDARNIPLHIIRVSVRQGASVEAEARMARYEAFKHVLQAGDALLLAQHQDDQAETVLFRLLRGAGVRGLGAMQAQASLTLVGGKVVPLWRPWLGLSRQVLEKYAAAESLEWVEDESNTDTRYARNFLRQDIFPALRQHWPEAGKTLAATAQRMQEADILLQEYALQLLAPLRLRHGSVSVGGLLALSSGQRKLLLRQLLREQGLPLPGEKILEQIERDVLQAAHDATPLLVWPGTECRRYRDELYFMAPLPELPPFWQAAWQGEKLLLPDGRALVASSWAWAGDDVVVRYRQGGEKIRPVGNSHHRDLKTLMQESTMPPWERSRVPLVFVNGELVGVVGCWYAEGARGVAIGFEFMSDKSAGWYLTSSQ